jgi:hypothetical protein
MSFDDEEGPWWRRLWPRRVRPAAPAADDAFFPEVVSDLSRKLAERAASQPTDPVVVARERQEALKAYDRARRHRRVLAGSVAMGALGALAIASLAPPGQEPSQASPVTTASAGEATRAPAADAIAQPFAPSGAATRPAEPPPVRTASLGDPPIAPRATGASIAPPTAGPTAATPLSAGEVREVQTRLRGFGFNPGPVDGDAGRMTTVAAMSYQQSRNQVQTGTVDRELLDQLRLDPAPQVAPPPPAVRRQPRPATRAAARHPGPFDGLGRWLDSLVR